MPKTKKADGGIKGAVKDLGQKMGIIKPEEKKSDAQIMAANREKGEQLVTLLRVAFTEFDKGRYAGREEDKSDSVPELRKKLAAMVRLIENSPTIFDDLQNIDDLLIFSANALISGIKEGRYNKVNWAISALSSGILYSRDNIPADKAEYKDKFLEERVKYLERYKTIIQTYDKVDSIAGTISNLKASLKEQHKKYDPQHEKMMSLLDTDEGKKLWGMVQNKAHDPGALVGTEAGDLADEIKRVAIMAHNIFIKNADLASARNEYDIAMGQAEDLRVELAHRPEVINPQLSALHATILAGQRERIAKAYADSASVIDTMENHDAQLRSIMSGNDAQKTLNYGLKLVEAELLGNKDKNNVVAAVKEGNRWAERKAKAELESKQALLQANEELLKSKEQLAQYDNDLLALANQLEALNEQIETVEAVNENEEENENLNFNT